MECRFWFEISYSCVSALRPKKKKPSEKKTKTKCELQSSNADLNKVCGEDFWGSSESSRAEGMKALLQFQVIKYSIYRFPKRKPVKTPKTLREKVLSGSSGESKTGTYFSSLSDKQFMECILIIFSLMDIAC